jgi:hypothetical protein
MAGKRTLSACGLNLADSRVGENFELCNESPGFINSVNFFVPLSSQEVACLAGEKRYAPVNWFVISSTNLFEERDLQVCSSFPGTS